MPTARAFWARRMIESSTSAGRDHHQVGELVDHAQDVGQRRLAALLAGPVELGQRAGPGQRHRPVALLHLLDQVLQRVGGHARAGDHRREQVRDRLVVVELDLLGVDEHEAHLVRSGAQQDAGQHRVDAGRLTCAGRAGHEQVRHLGQVGTDRPAADVLAQPHRQRRPVRRRLLQDVAEVDDAPARVGNLDADRLLAWDRGQDADVGGGQRVGEIILELGHLGHLGPGSQAQLVAGDVGSGDAADDLGLDPEVAERLGQRARHQLLAGRVGLGRLAGRAYEAARRGHPPDEVGVIGDRGAVAALRREIVRAPTVDAPGPPPATVCPRRARAALRQLGQLGHLGLLELELGQRFGIGPVAPRRGSRARRPRRCPGRHRRRAQTARRHSRLPARRVRPRRAAGRRVEVRAAAVAGRRMVAARSSVERRMHPSGRGHVPAAGPDHPGHGGTR